MTGKTKTAPGNDEKEKGSTKLSLSCIMVPRLPNIESLAHRFIAFANARSSWASLCSIRLKVVVFLVA